MPQCSNTWTDYNNTTFLPDCTLLLAHHPVLLLLLLYGLRIVTWLRMAALAYQSLHLDVQTLIPPRTWHQRRVFSSTIAEEAGVLLLLYNVVVHHTTVNRNKSVMVNSVRLISSLYACTAVPTCTDMYCSAPGAAVPTCTDMHCTVVDGHGEGCCTDMY